MALKQKPYWNLKKRGSSRATFYHLLPEGSWLPARRMNGNHFRFCCPVREYLRSSLAHFKPNRVLVSSMA